MALLDDLSVIQRASTRAINLLVLAQKTTVHAQDDGVLDDDTRITLTPAQKQAFLTAMAPLLTAIKNRAAALP